MGASLCSGHASWNVALARLRSTLYRSHQKPSGNKADNVHCVLTDLTWFIASIKAIAILIVDVGALDGPKLVQAGKGPTAGRVQGQESRIKAPNVLTTEYCGWEYK